MLAVMQHFDLVSSSRERFELGQKVLVLLLVAADRYGLIGRDHVAGAGHEDVESLGALAQSFDDERCLLLHPGLVQAQARGSGLLPSH